MRVTVTKRYNFGTSSAITAVEVETEGEEIQQSVNETVTEILDALEYREKVNTDN